MSSMIPKKVAPKTIAVIAVLILSFIMFLTGWMHAPIMSNYDVEYFKANRKEIKEEAKETVEALKEEGIKTSVNELMGIVDLACSGSISPMAFLRLGGFAKKFLNADGYYSMANMVPGVSNLGGSLTFFLVIGWILCILLILTFIASVLGLIMNKKIPVFAYSGIYTILFIIMAIAIISLNGKVGYGFFKISFTAIFGEILALAASALTYLFLKETSGYGSASGYGAPVGGRPGYGTPASSAPGYGTPVGGRPGYGAPASSAPGYGAPAGSTPGYGAPKVAIKNACPKCGTSNDPDAAFCRTCGNSLKKEIKAAPVEDSSTWRCPICDVVNSSSSHFCKACGSPAEVDFDKTVAVRHAPGLFDDNHGYKSMSSIPAAPAFEAPVRPASTPVAPAPAPSAPMGSFWENKDTNPTVASSSAENGFSATGDDDL